MGRLQADRSGLPEEHGIVVHDGTIDSGYCGEVSPVLFNFSDEEYTERSGDCIAQLIIQQYIAPKFVLVSLQRKIQAGEIRILAVQEVFNCISVF